MLYITKLMCSSGPSPAKIGGFSTVVEVHITRHARRRKGFGKNYAFYLPFFVKSPIIWGVLRPKKSIQFAEYSTDTLAHCDFAMISKVNFEIPELRSRTGVKLER